MVKDKLDFLNEKDLRAILSAKHKVQLAVVSAEKMSLEAKILDMEYRSLIQHIFIEYGLEQTDSIDETTGKIIRKEAEQQPEEDKGVE